MRPFGSSVKKLCCLFTSSTRHWKTPKSELLSLSGPSYYRCQSYRAMTALKQDSSMKRMLLVFDFDHTLIDDNVDTSVCKLSPGGELPEDVSALYKNDGWIEYMGAVFKHLHEQGISAKDFQEHVQGLPLAPGIEELFEHIRKIGSYDTIIISDANTVFIKYLLEHRQLDSLVSKVFTNPAEYDENGCLLIENFHTQDWCSLSTVNLCKGRILQDFIRLREKEGVDYSNVFYVGDGANDLCPGLTLREQDYLFPRKGFTLWKKLEKIRTGKAKDADIKVQASVVGYDSAVEIRTLLESLSAASNPSQ